MGAGTVTADDPLLTCRSVPGDSPHRYVLDGNLRTSAASQLVETARQVPVTIVTSKSAAAENAAVVKRLKECGVEVLEAAELPGREFLGQVADVPALDGGHPLERSACDQALGAEEAFLAGLKDEAHAVPLGRRGGVGLGAGQEAARVGVVAAGMHEARPTARIGQARLLGDRQGVHIRPEGHEGPLPANIDDDTAAAVARLEARRQKSAPDVGQGLGQLEPDLGNRVEGPPMRYGSFAKLLSVHTDDASFRSSSLA